MRKTLLSVLLMLFSINAWSMFDTEKICKISADDEKVKCKKGDVVLIVNGMEDSTLTAKFCSFHGQGNGNLIALKNDVICVSNGRERKVS